MKDIDVTLPFSQLDLSQVDFSSSNWSWGGDKHQLEIRWCDDIDGGFETKCYKVPQCILDIILTYERVAVADLRNELADIERRRNDLIFGDVK